MEPAKFLNYPICAVLGGIRETKGNMFGIELELEGRGVGLADVATRGWGRKHENSLRGEAMEYVTQGSTDFETSQKRVTELFNKFKDNKVKFNNSIRTSTHVHLNFSDKKVKDVVNFFALFTVLEEVLQYYSGEDRKGNLFCISSREAEGILTALFDGVGKGDLSRFAGDRYKYAACNLSSLYKFGTVEIRTMKGADTAEQVNAWLSILNDMYVYSLTKMKSPVDLVVDFSHVGAEGLMRKIFSEANYRELMNYFPKVASLRASLMEGVRLIQIFAYSYEQDFLAEIKIPEPKKGKGAGKPLPRQLQLVVYRADGGGRWHCGGAERVGEFWNDGERLVDDVNIYWNQALGRFCQHIPGRGAAIPLNWSIGPEGQNEGPPIGRLPPIREEEPDVEEEHDWEPDFDDEGEEI